MWSVTCWWSWCFPDQYVNPQAPNASSNGLIRRTSYGGLAILKQWLTCLPAGRNIAHWTRGCNWQCSELQIVSSGISTGGHCVSNKCWPQKSYDWKLRATMRVCKRLRLKFHAGSQRSDHYNERWKVPQSMSACFNRPCPTSWVPRNPSNDVSMFCCTLTFEKHICGNLARKVQQWMIWKTYTARPQRPGVMSRSIVDDMLFCDCTMFDHVWSILYSYLSVMSIVKTTCRRTVLHSSFAFRLHLGKGKGFGDAAMLLEHVRHLKRPLGLSHRPHHQLDPPRLTTYLIWRTWQSLSCWTGVIVSCKPDIMWYHEVLDCVPTVFTNCNYCITTIRECSLVTGQGWNWRAAAWTWWSGFEAMWDIPYVFL